MLCKFILHPCLKWFYTPYVYHCCILTTTACLISRHVVQYKPSYVTDLHDICLLISGEQIGHLASVEETVDVFQEGLLLDLTVSDEEHRRLAHTPRVLEQVLTATTHSHL